MRKLIVLLSLGLLLGISACTIVPIEEIEQLEASEEFDPAAFVDGIWEDQVIPAILENTSDLPLVLTALQANLDTAGSQYGVERSSGGYNFPVKGQGTISSVDTESRNGTAIVTLDGYNGSTEVVIQVGPLIRGDAIRDGVGFIQFGDFKEQTEFGKVSRELNSRVAEEIVGDIDLESLAGKTISFSGVFTVLTTNQTNIDLSSVTITPMEFEVSE